MKIVKGCISFLISVAIAPIVVISMGVRTGLHNVLMVLGLIVAGLMYIVSLITSLSRRIAEARQSLPNSLYNKLWRDILCECEIFPEHIAKEVATQFLIRDKIDPRAFAANYREMRVGNEDVANKNGDTHFATASITKAIRILRRSPVIPYWFIAAYPDACLWYSEVVESVILSSISTIQTPLQFRIDAGMILDKPMKQNAWLRDLVSSYKRNTIKGLETRIEQ
jgi:hypothetical protein